MTYTDTAWGDGLLHIVAKASSTGSTAGIPFVPMLSKTDDPDDFIAKAKIAINGGARFVAAMNEPNEDNEDEFSPAAVRRLQSPAN